MLARFLGSALSATALTAAIAVGGPDPYDPLARARASAGTIVNPDAHVPPQCFARTDGVSNACWTCHTAVSASNTEGDWMLQMEHSGVARVNRWENLVRDRSADISRISDAEVLAYIRTDNYTPLREALAGRKDFPGFVPDLDLQAGFDEEGFARDGSGWRALRYKPFPGAFWPTNGSADDVFIRLPRGFRTRDGAESREVYKANLAILEAAIATAPHRDPGLPAFYSGDASGIPVRRYLYPDETELLHTVRYVDPDAPALLSARLKEMRYSRKLGKRESWMQGSHAQAGPVNGLGWQLQGFIEDERGRLRLQTDEEHRSCMGCHGGLGVTVDGTFAMARKVPGAEGWRHQDLRGIPDVPQSGHPEPETLTYLNRVQGGDELRANGEMLARFFPIGILDRAEVLRAARGGDRDLAWLLTPSRERALRLGKAYMVLVREQSFEKGRDAFPDAVTNVQPGIPKGSTDLARTGKVFHDGHLWLDW